MFSFFLFAASTSFHYSFCNSCIISKSATIIHNHLINLFLPLHFLLTVAFSEPLIYLFMSLFIHRQISLSSSRDRILILDVLEKYSLLIPLHFLLTVAFSEPLIIYSCYSYSSCHSSFIVKLVYHHLEIVSLFWTSLRNILY
jgi:hypothetical protein